MERATWDVIVIGGGPAGSLTALDLARGGCRVAVLDASHPRMKPCSGFFSHALPTLHPVLAGFADREPFVGPRRYATPGGRAFVVPGALAPTRFDLASRETLDLYLIEEAAHAGATWLRERALAVARAAGGWEVRTDAGPRYGKVLVGADGARSLVRRAVAGPIGRVDLVIGAGRRYPGERATELYTRFLPGGGIGFVLPGRGFAQAVVAARLTRARDLSRRLSAFADAHVPSWRGPFVRWMGLQPSPISRDFFRPARAGDDWCLIGDAAGHDDALTGEGLPFAVQGATEAAAAILAGRPSAYEERWRDRFGARLERAAARARRAAPEPLLDLAAWALARSPSLVAIAARAGADGRLSHAAGRLLVSLPRVVWELVRG